MLGETAFVLEFQDMTDAIIIGSGAAGLTTSLFLSRYGIDHILIGENPGGQIADATVIENYPGIESITGVDLAEKFVTQVKKYPQLTLVEDLVTAIEYRAGPGKSVGMTGDHGGVVFQVTTRSGATYSGKAILFAMGAKHRGLNVPGEDKFLGTGIFYSVKGLAEKCQGKNVAVVGGGNSALTAVQEVAKTANKVYLIHRRDEYRADKIYVDGLKQITNLEELKKRIVVSVSGADNLEMIGLAATGSGGESQEIPVEILIITIGLMPAVTLAKDLGVAMTNDNYIKINAAHATNVAGVFAAGDLSQQPGGIAFRQIITSAGEGALAAASIYKYLKGDTPSPNWS